VSPEAPAPRSPTSRSDLFWSFTWLALQGFGGVLAVVQRELVERRRWLTREQFVEEWAVAQILPGPNVINLSITLGARYFGASGAFAAVSGMLAAPMLVALLIAVAFGSVAEHPMVQGALRGMGAVAAGLIAATGLKLLPALGRNVMGRSACVALGLLTGLGIVVWRLPLAWVLLAVGGLGWGWAWVRLDPAREAAP
jgi:chromate transporter